MDVKNSYSVSSKGDTYQTVVREFDETRGLWEEVTYNTVDGIEYVISRTPLYETATKKVSSTPNAKTTPAKPTKVNKPVLEMTKPKKPSAFVLTPTQATQEDTTPGPMPIIEEKASAGSTATQSNSKYLYSYGIKNIAIEHKTYSDKGVFISKPMEIEGNVIELSLLSNEEHPLFDDLSGKATDRMTSIEYYIAYEENPSLSDWHAILPEGQTDIRSERLFFQNSTAVLRFHAKLDQEAKTAVYKNGIKLDKSKWCLVERGASLQLMEKRDLTAIYTIDYVPDSVFTNPWSLNVKEKGASRVKHIDTFPKGTAYNKTITLSKYPYIDFEYINGKAGYTGDDASYRPFDIYLRNGAIAVGNGKNVNTVFPKAVATANTPFTTNKTDYKNGLDMKLTPYSISPDTKYAGFEYKQERNKLIFSETFNRADINGNEQEVHGNAEIEVQYEYLVTKFRMKIILRKNTGTQTVVSPRVNDYQIKFKIMK